MGFGPTSNLMHFLCKAAKSASYPQGGYTHRFLSLLPVRTVTERASPSNRLHGSVVTKWRRHSCHVPYLLPLRPRRLSRTERMNRAVFYPFQNARMRHLHNGCARHPSRKSVVLPLFTPFYRVKHEDRLDIQAREIELRILRNHRYKR